MYFFDTTEKQSMLKEELESWRETPYRHWCGVKGLGCDCIHMIVRVLENFGFGPIKVPWYPPDWHLHNDAELLLEGIRKEVPHEEYAIDIRNGAGLQAIANGDLLLFKYGQTLSHSAWWFDGYLYHAVYGAEVLKTSWKDKMWRKRARIGFKVLRA